MHSCEQQANKKAPCMRVAVEVDCHQQAPVAEPGWPAWRQGQLPAAAPPSGPRLPPQLLDLALQRPAPGNGLLPRHDNVS